jgi:hypothetical protein
MLRGTNQEPWIQKSNLGSFLTDFKKRTPTLALVSSERSNHILL